VQHDERRREREVGGVDRDLGASVKKGFARGGRTRVSVEGGEEEGEVCGIREMPVGRDREGELTSANESSAESSLDVDAIKKPRLVSTSSTPH
jgi:hypothetical protein